MNLIKGTKVNARSRTKWASVVTIGVAAVGLSLASAPAASAQVTVEKLTQAQAEAIIAPAGITWSSRLNCTDRLTLGCTSFEQLNRASALGVVTLRNASGCRINIGGGTEVGHASGTYSHWNGYKLDVFTVAGDCINNYVINSFTYVGDRGDAGGAPMYKAGSGNLYVWEVARNHWDITYYSCGCS